MARKPAALNTRITRLEMTAPPKASLPVPVNLQTAIIRATEIPLHYYRYLYRQVGKRWSWFERLRLSDEELALYQRLSERSPLPQVTPDLVIFLQAAPENLIARVRRRASASERTVDDTYLVRLADAYSHFAYHYDACPVMIVNSDNLNFADRDDDFHLLLERLGQQRSHREFFNLGG